MFSIEIHSLTGRLPVHVTDERNKRDGPHLELILRLIRHEAHIYTIRH